METFDLIEKYLLENMSHYLEVRCDDYEMNGSIIKIRYSYKYDWSEDRNNDSDNVLEVYVLDYITWVFNQCTNKDTK